VLDRGRLQLTLTNADPLEGSVMLALFNPVVDLAYHLVSWLAAGLTVLPWGLATAAAIVAFTMAMRLAVLPLSYYAMRGQDAQARLAPQVQHLRQRYSRQPDRLRAELAGLYRREGTGMLSGCLPVLLQAPVLSVMYLLFRSPTVDGRPNGLLTHDLFGAALGSHWLGGPGPLSAQGVAFFVIFALLALIGWLHARMLGAAIPAATAGDAATAATGQQTAPQGTALSVLTRLAPQVTVVVAAFVPLAAGLYLVTTTAWTVAERTVLRRRIAANAGPRALNAAQRTTVARGMERADAECRAFR
jgi:YidC/Oxa1 family membrane protein insertase